jgi:carboxymethylenebutenolidase
MESPRHGEWIDIAVPDSDVKIKTFVVYPERKEKAPVVIVIHEIFGLTDWVRGVADTLAANGFIAVAPDLLSGMGPNGGGTVALGEKVREEIRKLTPEDQAKRLDAVAAHAQKFDSTTGKVAAIGFCWGGSASFNYACRRPRLRAAVAYYGAAPAEKDLLGKINCPVLGLYGGNDNRVTSTVESTTASMRELQKSYDPHVYEGAGHGFLRQQSGQNGANATAAKQAWGTTIEFLKKNLEQ